MTNEAISKSRIEGNVVSTLEEISKFNFNWMKDIKEESRNKDFGDSCTITKWYSYF